jgi:uncharacterized lipoprotein YmbA
MKPVLGRLKPAATLLLLAGCSFFSRTKNNIYSLERVPGSMVAAHGLPVSIDSLELPPGFNRREVVVRKADHQLDVRSTEQWSASLQPLVLHTLAFDLAARLPDGMVVLPGQVRPAGAMRAVDVVFEDLAAGPDNAVVLDARWIVRPGAPHHDRISIPIASLDSAEIASGVSRALAALADRIAAQLGGPSS